ncbi:MAG: AAA family ATPase [Deltaproteobacteria bacterium]|nr:AAA family ATPase [Deltaproteobacteria bacterium]
MSLPPIIKGLLDPAAYLSRPARVTLIQTHISYILLTPDIVYKIKKPVDFGFLDFTTLKKRLYFCREEVRLNRALAPGMYLGVVPIARERGGFRMEGKGRPVEYAVKMKRIPPDATLESMIKQDSVLPSTIVRIASAIAGFHGKAARGPRISSYGNLNAVRKNTGENFSQTARFVGSQGRLARRQGRLDWKTITRERYGAIKEYTRGFLENNSALFVERARGGFIRDCHGDIHSEHVCVEPGRGGISIFDCIEFNRRFRCSDVVADMAFLSMDLDFRGRGDLARVFDRAYFSRTKDRRGARLLNFYKCYRAYVRGKVESFRLIEPEETARDKRAAFLNAMRYFHLAHKYSKGGTRPAMVVVAGLAGTGKSAVAKALGDATGMAVLSSDEVRKLLFSIPLTEHRHERFAKGIYSKEATDRTYRELIKKAFAMLSSGRSVILDATFSKEKHLERARKAAEKCGASFHVIACTADDETVKKRIEKRASEAGAVSDATWTVYKKQKGLFEEIKTAHLELSTGAPERELIVDVIRWLTGNC